MLSDENGLQCARRYVLSRKNQNTGFAWPVRNGIQVLAAALCVMSD